MPEVVGDQRGSQRHGMGSDFNFHHEHHLYPIVPGWQLPRLHRELQGCGLDAEDVRKSYLDALLEIWRNLHTGSRRRGE